MTPGEHVSHTRCFLLSYFFITICFLVLGQTNAKKELKFVVVIFRHGDRSPVGTYPKDIYQQDSWPDGFEQLTEIGMEQQYELGRYLRTRYFGFLNDTYSRNEVYVRSTDMDRTLMSAQANLAGLYPPVGRQIWNKNIAWQPVPVHTVSLNEDKLLHFPLKNCPQYNKLKKETYNSKEFYDIINPYKEFINSLENGTGYSAKELNEEYKWWIAYDALFCEQMHNFTLPNWATKDAMEKLSQLFQIGISSFFDIYKHQEKSRLQGGVLVGSILKNLTNAATNPTSNLKLIMYSGHDTTLAALQIALNVYNGKISPYAACHIFELYKGDNGEYSIEMHYRNDSSVKPYLITLPGCSPSCPLTKFTELTSSIIVEDWEKECGADEDRKKSSGSAVGLIIAVVFLSIAVLFLLALCCCYRKKSLNYDTV